MTTKQKELLFQLIHDVNSKCANLKNAVALLEKASPQDAHEFLALMVQDAQVLARRIVDCEQRWNSSHQSANGEQ